MPSVSPLRLLDYTKALWGYLFVFALGYTVAVLQRSYAASKRFTEAEVSPVAVPPKVKEAQHSKAPEKERNDHSASQRIESEISPEVQGEVIESPVELLDGPARNWADDEDWVHIIPAKSQEQVEESENPWDVDVPPSRVPPHSSKAWGSVSTETHGEWGKVHSSKKSKGKFRAPGQSSGQAGPKRDGYLCPQYFRPFGTEFALQEHFRQVHPSGPPAQRWTKTAGATCEICHASLASASEVRRHASNEHPWSYLCTAHLKSFRDPYQALDHYREVHQAHDVTFDTIEAFLGKIKPRSTQNKSTEPILVQGPASAGAVPGDAIPDQSAVQQAPPDDARHSAAAQVHDAVLKRHTFTANSIGDHSNGFDPGDSSTSGPMVQVPAEPATTPLMCLICRQVFKDHPRLAQHALYPCTRFLAPGQKTFFDPKPATPNRDPVKVIADRDYDESAVFSAARQAETAEAASQVPVDAIDVSEERPSHLDAIEVVDAPSSSSSEDLDGSDGLLLTPEESADDDDVHVLSPDPTGTSMYAESVQSQGTFLVGPMDGMTPDALQRAEFTSSNRWNTGGPPVASRRNIPQHVRTYPDFAPARRPGMASQAQYYACQRRSEPALNVDDGGIETQIPSFGLPARGAEFQPFGTPSSEQASSLPATSPRSKAQIPKLGPPGKPKSALLKPFPVPPHATPTSLAHPMSNGQGVSTLHTQHSQYTYRQPHLPAPPSHPSARTLKGIAQARPVAQTSRRGEKPALQPVFDSGWQTLPVQQSTKSRGGKTQSYDPWGSTSSVQPEADEGDYGGW